MKCKFFVVLSVISALVIAVMTAITWEYAYIVFWVAVCFLVVGVIGALLCGDGKKLFDYLEKII